MIDDDEEVFNTKLVNKDVFFFRFLERESWVLSLCWDFALSQFDGDIAKRVWEPSPRLFSRVLANITPATGYGTFHFPRHFLILSANAAHLSILFGRVVIGGQQHMPLPNEARASFDYSECVLLFHPQPEQQPAKRKREQIFCYHFYATIKRPFNPSHLFRSYRKKKKTSIFKN